MRNLILLFAAAGAVAAADLPVREVVLYKNGIGYFRRAGELRAGESARLEFKAPEMDDVLKSLTLAEEGGRIGGLRYDSSDLLGRKMAEFPFRVGDRQPLSALLDQLKGARVELKVGTEAAAGTIVGARDVLPSNSQPGREELTLLTDAGLLRTIDLTGVSGIRFTDAALQLQLKDYLANLAHSRSKEKRAVYIDSSDARTRRLAATYVIPTPVWKSSYRLVFMETGDPTLEGWAIVDNTSGDDWTNVRLALVSGRPVSFISRLYEPRYLARPFAELPEDRAAAPEIHRGGYVAGVAGGVVAGVPPPPPAKLEAPAPRAKAKQEVLADRVSSSIESAASGELGELFEYRFTTPVTVKKDESAMLPFLQDRIKARKLLIYTVAGGENPRNAAEVVNSTGKTLDGGPITVYDGNAYAGEALMETLKAADKRLISYAVDLGTRITTKIDSTQDLVREVHFRRGLLTARAAYRETRTYTVRNVDQKPKVLIVEHPIRPGYDLLNVKPAEKTQDAYRFEVKLAAGATEKFPVAEENIRENSVMLSSATPDLLLSYVQNRNLDAAARRALEDIARQKQAIADNDAEIRRAGEQLSELARDEERTRQNIENLNRVSGQQDQVQNYARQLAAQEARIASLRDSASELRKKKAALEAALRAAIDKMEF